MSKHVTESAMSMFAKKFANLSQWDMEYWEMSYWEKKVDVTPGWDFMGGILGVWHNLVKKPLMASQYMLYCEAINVIFTKLCSQITFASKLFNNC